MKTQVEHSIRAYDGAKLTWHRYKKFNEYDWSFWVLVRVDHG